MSVTSLHHTAKERFLRYVTIDTQSDPNSPTQPSTEKQKDLGRVLVEELLAMGLSDAHLDEYGYVYATIPANTDKAVPVICFCSHMDTSPDCSGAGVKPIVHKNYQGQDLVLPDDPSVVIREKENHEDLVHQHGNDIITASGTTLLGADNKAGLAAIMDAAQILLDNPQWKHGKIRLLFTPDEEIGRGVDKVDMEKLGAQFGYTIDGETAGSIEDATFSADAALVTVHGVSAHPGFAKGNMESAIKIAAKIVAQLPDELSPEHTEGMEGFLHPVHIEGSVELATIKLILRDFEESELKKHAQTLQQIVDASLEKYPNSTATIRISEQYRNMARIVRQHPQVVDYALEAMRRAGFEKPIQRSIRGGTDGSRLSYLGMPCPNIFAGEHAFHSKQEWVSVQDMEKAAETVVHLAQVWEERS
ncbi:MAG: peptidase T [Saprospiraceae bacterium]